MSFKALRYSNNKRIIFFHFLGNKPGNVANVLPPDVGTSCACLRQHNGHTAKGSGDVRRRVLQRRLGRRGEDGRTRVCRRRRLSPGAATFHRGNTQHGGLLARPRADGPAHLPSLQVRFRVGQRAVPEPRADQDPLVRQHSQRHGFPGGEVRGAPRHRRRHPAGHRVEVRGHGEWAHRAGRAAPAASGSVASSSREGLGNTSTSHIMAKSK